MSFHHKKLFSINYRIRSVSVFDSPKVVSSDVTPTKDESPTRKQNVRLLISQYPYIEMILINLVLPAYQAKELEQMCTEQRDLVLSFNKIEEEQEDLKK